SHDLGAVGSFCSRAMVLLHGQPAFLGRAPDAVGHYQLLASDSGDDGDLMILDAAGRRSPCFQPGERGTVDFRGLAGIDHAAAIDATVTRIDDGLVVFEESVDVTLHRPSQLDLQLNLVPGEYEIGIQFRVEEENGSPTRHAARFAVIGQPCGTGVTYP